MFKLGAARDINIVNVNRRPTSDQILYEGVVNDSLIRCSDTNELVDVVTHTGVDSKGRLYVGLEVISVLDRKPRGPKPIDIVFCIDVSGSMSSHLSGQDPTQKLEAAKMFTRMLLDEYLRPDDRFAVCIFSDTGSTLVAPSPVTVGAAADALKAVKTQGGTNVEKGMAESFRVAREMGTPGRECRVLVLSDMSDGEVQAALTPLLQLCTDGANLGIGTTYIGLGEDFRQDLTNKLTVTSGCNYFCIKSADDFRRRVAKESASAFFPTVQEVEVSIVAKQHRVVGVHGAGKKGTNEKEDKVKWTRDTQHLFGASVQATAEELREKAHLPNDVVGLVVEQKLAAEGQARPMSVFHEHSVFPSSTSQKPGYQEGGWVLVELAPSQEDAEFVRFDLRYKKDAGAPDTLVRRDVSLREAVSHVKDGAVWGSDEGMIHATVLKEFVSRIKETLDDHNAKQFPPSLKEWVREMQNKHGLDLQKQLKLIDDMEPKLSL